MRMWWNGRHDSFRSYWRKLRGGSTPLIRTIIYILLLSIAFVPKNAFAADTLLPQDLNEAIKFIIEWVSFRIGPGLIGIMIIYAGFQYIGSKGNEVAIKAAKDRIIGSVLGFILLLLIGTIMRAFFL